MSSTFHVTYHLRNRENLPGAVIEYYPGESTFGRMKMDDSRSRIWFIYCLREKDDNACYLAEIEQLARQVESSGLDVCLEPMDFIIGKGLWDQMVDKIFELKICYNLQVYESCIFFISRNMLGGEAFLEERAFVLGQAREYPRGVFPLTGLVYV